jgi:hypothetical protein
MPSPKLLKRELAAARELIKELQTVIDQQNFQLAQYDDDLTQCKQQLAACRDPGVLDEVIEQEAGDHILQEQEQ